MTRKLATILDARFEHPIYSPKGEIEGVLLSAEGAPVQIVFERHDSESPAAFEGVRPGQTVRVETELLGPSPKGAAEHAVHAFGRLLEVDGRKPSKPSATAAAGYRGTIVRFNYARHGAANGVVLDTGDFIHTKPDGLARLKLKIGAVVTADGDARQLVDGSGWAVEATVVNGKSVAPA